MFRPPFSRSGINQDLLAFKFFRFDDLCHRRLPLRQGAGLIQDNGVQTMGGLEGLSPANQDPVLRALSCSDHDRGGCCQSQGTGTGNDEDSDKVEKGIGERRRWPEEIPGNECDDGYGDHNRYKIACDDIGHPGNRRFRSLGFLNQPDNLGKNRIPPNFGRFKF